MATAEKVDAGNNTTDSVICAKCKGTGLSGEHVKCRDCRGFGFISPRSIPCGHCKGSGFLKAHVTCSYCGGFGNLPVK
jgi:DnaJ-class molecular chaperone